MSDGDLGPTCTFMLGGSAGPSVEEILLVKAAVIHGAGACCTLVA